MGAWGGWGARGGQRVRKVQINHVLGSTYHLGPLFLEDNELRCLVGEMAA